MQGFLKVMSLTPWMSRFCTLTLDDCSEVSKKHTTSPLWIRTLARTEAGTPYLPSPTASSSHVTAGYPVGHMT